MKTEKDVYDRLTQLLDKRDERSQMARKLLDAKKPIPAVMAYGLLIMPENKENGSFFNDTKEFLENSMTSKKGKK